MPSFPRLLPVLLCACSLAACAVAPAPSPLQPSGGHLVTAEEIHRSGARTAWEVLERRPGLLRAGRLGAAPLSPRGGPLLVVDGARMTDLAALRQIPAGSIRSIEVLSGVAAPTLGPGSADGVIVIRTAPPLPR